MKSSIKVSIFEDNPIMLDAYKAILNGIDGYTCVGAYSNCDDLQHNIERSMPNVVLMDIEMYGINGIEATQKIKELYPQIKILIQTIFEEDDKIFAALCAGANGYITKNTSPVKMLEAITDVYNGGSAMSPSIAAKMFILFKQIAPAAVPAKDYHLTNREKEILTLMAEGMPMPKVAEKIFLSYETVRSYVKSIYSKLHVASATEAVSKSIKERII
jgi:DNA-binding NarL/FixJ family response regulator